MGGSKRRQPKPERFVDELGEILRRSLEDHLEGKGESALDAAEIRRRVRRAVPEAIRQASEALVESFYETQPNILRHRRRERRGFESRLLKRWGPGIDQLELLLEIYRHVGATFLRDGHLSPYDPADPTFKALCQLHARSCRIGAEILQLIGGGFADGALARWRTLHELSVVINVIANGEVDLAVRYLAHAEAQMHRGGKIYEENRRPLGLRTLGKAVLARNEARLRELQARYGQDFGNDWGWAAKLTGKSRPKFTDVEAKAQLTHFRPYYKWASDRVHGGASGLSPIGLEAEHGRVVMLAGASNVGLADPGQNTAISLAQITGSLGLHRRSMDFVVQMNAVATIARRCVEGFITAHKAVEAERPPRERPRVKRRSGASRQKRSPPAG